MGTIVDDLSPAPSLHKSMNFSIYNALIIMEKASLINLINRLQDECNQYIIINQY